MLPQFPILYTQPKVQQSREFHLSIFFNKSFLKKILPIKDKCIVYERISKHVCIHFWKVISYKQFLTMDKLVLIISGRIVKMRQNYTIGWYNQRQIHLASISQFLAHIFFLHLLKVYQTSLRL